jgi:signal transduction histidine kinase
VPETCDGLLALIRPLAERKQIDLRLVYGADAGAGGSKLPLVTTDATKLQQVVFNFLSNAVKFTPEGGRVTLRAEKLASADGQDRVRLSVIDTGPGIPEDQQDAVFEKFRQLDSGLARAHTGTGLGLAIAKEFAEMLGAEIQLVSAPAQGSTFSVILPIEPAVERLTKPAEPEELALEILAGGDAAPAPTPTSDAAAEPRSDAAD